jgi:hypothetical protein
MEKIHPKYKCYMHTPMLISQQEGFSDIEKRQCSYTGIMEQSLVGFRQPDHTNKDKEYILELSSVVDIVLPNVTIVTPTKNRHTLFSMALNNYNMFKYPKEKIEWIIVEQVPEILGMEHEQEGVYDLLPKKIRSKTIIGDSKVSVEKTPIRYFQIQSNEYIPIARMRNICNGFASHDIIIHMDDDDYYEPISIETRVKVLAKYAESGVECVGCSKIGVYDILGKKSTITSDGILSLSEASLAYTKKFWQDQQFDENDHLGEYRGLIMGRFEKVMDIPYSFVLIAMKHGTNTAQDVKKMDIPVQKDGKDYSFFDHFDEDTQELINGLQIQLSKKIIPFEKDFEEEKDLTIA